MPDQQSNDANRGTDRATDPLGADAALRSADGDRQPDQRASDDARAAFTAAPAAATAAGDHGAAHDGARMLASAGAVGGGAVHVARDVLRDAIGATEDVASGLVGGVTHVAAEVVHGVRDVGYEVRDGANGLIGAVGAIGGTAVHTVAGLLADVVGGVRHVVDAAMGHNGHTQARAPERAVAAEGEASAVQTGRMPPPGARAGGAGSARV